MNPLTKKVAAAVLVVAFALPIGAIATSTTPCPNNRPYYDSTVLEQSQWRDPKAKDETLRSVIIRFDKDTNRELEPGRLVYLWTLIGYTEGAPIEERTKDPNDPNAEPVQEINDPDGNPVQEPKPHTGYSSRYNSPTDTGMWYLESNGLAGFQPEDNKCQAPDGKWVILYRADEPWKKAPLA